MIISASRRTDIPAYYSEWFLNRINEGFVLARNPMNFHQISKISLSPDAVDCIVFWSKNPKPMLNKLRLLNKYHFYFQFTLNGYGKDTEPYLPQKSEVIDTFKRLSEKIGAEKVIWRYDPILFNDDYTFSYHIENFDETARRLNGYTEKVTVSFMDFYKKTAKNVKELNIREADIKSKSAIAKAFSKIAAENNMLIDTCAENIDLSEYGISRARCVDGILIERITEREVKICKDKNQRSECGCTASVDIGVYNSCLTGCLYCYANYSRGSIEKNIKNHDTSSPLLIGKCADGDIIRNRERT